MADASHELKTPLTVILANTGILLRHPDDTIMQQQKWVDSTKAEGERMKELIDHMLFLAKTDADQMALSFSPLDLNDTLWSCLLPFVHNQGEAIPRRIFRTFLNGPTGLMRRVPALRADMVWDWRLPKRLPTATRLLYV